MATLICSFKPLGYVNTFLIVLNHELPRIPQEVIDSILLLRKIFGPDFLKNSLLVVTKFTEEGRFSKTPVAVDLNTEMQLMECYTGLFQEIFSFIPDSDQFCFIQNGDDIKQSASVFERKKLELSVARIKNFMDTNLP